MTPALDPPRLARTTVFSPDRVYRYTLWREWGIGTLPLFNHQEKPDSFVQFIGLNPSTANETKDDPTIRRCISFAKQWGFGALCMTNLFAYRATDPNEMLNAPLKSIDPVGPENDSWLLAIAARADKVILAWGTKGHAFYRDDVVLNYLRTSAYCLRRTKDGHPEHPLYLPKTCQPILWTP